MSPVLFMFVARKMFEFVVLCPVNSYGHMKTGTLFKASSKGWRSTVWFMPLLKQVFTLHLQV